jgi:Haem-NO-binding
LKTGWATGPGPLRHKRSAPVAAPYDRLTLHGLIFTTFRDFVTTQYGPAIAASVLAEQPPHVLTEAYPDEEFIDAVKTACRVTGVDTDDLVREFGIFAGETTFPRLYSEYYSVAGSARSFLLTVEGLIHELVRATIPNAAPPRLEVAPLGDDGVSIEYSSPRKLCVLLRGLVEGTARHYGETAEIHEPACMHRGDAACRFEIRFRSNGGA